MGDRICRSSGAGILWAAFFYKYVAATRVGAFALGFGAKLRWDLSGINWLDGSGRYSSRTNNEDLREVRKGESTFMNWDIFRAYDIRGVYPDDLDESAYYRIAKAYTYLFQPKTMVAGMDARESSPKLKAALISGFVDAGGNVVDIGGITTATR